MFHVKHLEQRLLPRRTHFTGILLRGGTNLNEDLKCGTVSYPTLAFQSKLGQPFLIPAGGVGIVRWF
jgi:hypothetical protein